ncbi:hypothetical protein [Levilactobacillus sp. HBUAS70063]|uniref:hypothetical protein n=1 Tax=Levilactobacillus sp. HBUAS70063 TaxID=3109359 RepID=UPI003133551F
MTKLAINGKLTAAPKVLSLEPLLLYAKINATDGTTINGLIHQHALNFLAQASTGSQVAVYGHYNARHQFVIEKFTVIASSVQTAS